MLNMFVVKKWVSFCLCVFLPTISFTIGLQFYDFWVGLVCFIVAGIVSIISSNIIIKNPFSSMIEGEGLLTFSIDSSGVIMPFITHLMQPYIKGKISKNTVTDVFDREAVMQLCTAEKQGKAVYQDGKLYLVLDHNEFNKSRFGMFQYPVLIYNDQIKSLLTKDMLSDNEKQSFAEHTILYLNRKMEELTSIVRDFGRYVVELTRPQEAWYQNKWIWIIVGIVVVILIAVFAGPLVQAISKSGGQAVEGIKSLNPVG